MSSSRAIAEVAAALRVVLDELSKVRSRAVASQRAVSNAKDRMAALSAGSTHPLLRQIHSRYTLAGVRLREADVLIASAIELIQTYNQIIVATGSGSASDRGYIPATTVEAAGSARPPAADGSTDSDSTPVVASLIDEAARALQYQQQSTSLLSHVESHVAAAMRRGQAPHDATLVLNNRTCRGPLSCDNLLPGIMPAGARLAVHVTDGDQTMIDKVYHGTGERIRP